MINIALFCISDLKIADVRKKYIFNTNWLDLLHTKIQEHKQRCNFETNDLCKCASKNQHNLILPVKILAKYPYFFPRNFRIFPLF